MDGGVKVACVSILDSSERVESPDMKLNESQVAIFAWHCVLSDHHPVLWWLSHGEGWDAVT